MVKLFKIVIVTGIVANVFSVAAQNGEQLFKKCFTCHTLGKKSTGPDLVGVRAKWVDAGEGDNLITWVKNANVLITSGKSPLANAIKDFSPTTMDPQDLSTEEINAIFDYIDAWTPPAETPTIAEGETVPTEVKYVPNYQKNLTIFYWFTGLTILLLLAIIITSGSISVLIKSDYFKERIAKNKNGNSTVLSVIVLIGFFFAGNELFALTFNRPGMAQEGQPWLLVENQDLYFFLVIDLVLLGVLFYLRSMFMNFMKMVRKPKEKAIKSPVTKKLNKVLTDAVDIEEEHTILLHHEYDGIRELDNNLPPWWVWGFYATIVFSVVYIFHYHVLGTGDLQEAEYNKKMITKQKEVEAYLIKMAMNVDETTADLMEDDNDLKQGKVLFDINCATCHLEDGSGKIGPNLTDKAWIYGYDIKEVFGIIKYGTSNGMPEHASKLKPTQIQQVASYLLHFKEIDGGKEAEGEIIRPESE